MNMTTTTSYLDTLPLELYSHVWKFLLVLDKPNEYVEGSADFNAIFAFMLVHKRAKEAFESTKGWTLFYYLLCLEHRHLYNLTKGPGHTCSPNRLEVMLGKAARLAVSHDDSTKLQNSCDLENRKRKRDKFEQGAIPLWLQTGARVVYRRNGHLLGGNDCHRIVDLDIETRTATVQFASRRGEQAYDAPVNRLRKFQLDRFFVQSPVRVRVRVIGGDYKGLEGALLCRFRNRYYFRDDDNGRILKARDRHLIIVGEDL